MHVLVIADQNDSSSTLGISPRLKTPNHSGNFAAGQLDAEKIANAWSSAAPHVTVQPIPFAATADALPKVWAYHSGLGIGVEGTALVVCLPHDENWQAQIAEEIFGAVDAGATRLVVALPRYAYPDAGVGVLSELLSLVEYHEAKTASRELTNPENFHNSVYKLSEFFAQVDVIVAHSENLPLTGMHGMSGTAGLLGDLSQQESQDLERVNAQLLHGLTKFGAPQQDQKRTGLELQLTSGSGNQTYKELARHDAAGNAGGLGFALLVAGARALPLNLVLSGVFNLPQAVAGSDLIVVKQEHLDGRTFSHSTLGVVTDLALKYAIPVIAITSEQIMSTRELAAAGVSSCYSCTNEELEYLSARLAISWTPNR